MLQPSLKFLEPDQGMGIFLGISSNGHRTSISKERSFTKIREKIKNYVDGPPQICFCLC